MPCTTSLRTESVIVECPVSTQLFKRNVESVYLRAENGTETHAYKRVDLCRFLIPEKQYELSACVAYVHNIESLELRLVEFIEYHRIIGVDHFFFYDRAGRYSDFLTSHYPPEIVTNIYWPGVAQNRTVIHTKFAGFYDQIIALNHCLFQNRHLAKWTGMFDLDEWLSVPDGRKATQFLADEMTKKPLLGEIILPRLEFRTKSSFNESQLVIEQFTEARHAVSSQKYFVRADWSPAVTIHYCELNPGLDAERLSFNFTAEPKVPRWNHYINLYHYRAGNKDADMNSTDLFVFIPEIRLRMQQILDHSGYPVMLDTH